MIYWDNNSTTPCAPEVVEAMRPYWNEEYGNPFNSHLMGRRAEWAVTRARQQVAQLSNALEHEIIFTSGATESNNLLFLGILLSRSAGRRRIVVSSVEHKAVLDPALMLAKHGFEIVKLPVDATGKVDIKQAKTLITEETLLVSVQTANNELGTLQPVRESSDIAHENGAFFHTDAAQALGKVPFDVEEINCDFASISAHKLYGPKGVGGLFVRGGPKRWPWARPFQGGGQEGGLRPGTSNVPGIVGFGEACRIAREQLHESIRTLSELSACFVQQLKREIPELIVNNDIQNSLPGTLSITIPDIPADLLIDNLRTVAMSKSSACTNQAVSISHVLKAINMSDTLAECTFRISLSRYSTLEDIYKATDMIKQAIREIQILL